MVVSKNQNDRIVEDLIHNLEYLIRNIKIDGTDLIAVRTELDILIENVKNLSDLDTRVALLEKSVEVLEEWKKASDRQIVQENIDHYKNLNQENSSLKTANRSGTWGITAAVIAGFLGLVGSIINHFWK